MSDFSFLRATELYQQAGAYYVRIQAMAKAHSITLRQEFDEHDAPETKYIVVLDGEFPVATCRMYLIDEKTVMMGRVVVLPEYRGHGLGRRTVQAGLDWMKEEGIKKVCIESRTVAMDFYKKLGFNQTSDEIIHGETFDCIPMEIML